MSGEFILVVDDNPTNLSVISQALRSVGWQVRIAVDGEDALSKVAQNQPELILLDVMMPGIDGFEVCRRLKANAATADIPIIFMTALADSDSKVKGLSLGAVDYIPKPFEREEAIARVRVHLQLRRLTQTLEQQVQERTAQLTQALEDLQTSQLQVIQSEKMSALGNLVAGVAHEINNPIGCILGNVSFIHDSIHNLFQAIDLYRQNLPDAELTIALEALELDYLREDLPELVRAIQDGGDRIKGISASLRTFSRADTEHKVSANLHEGLESTLLILKYRLKANEFRPAIEVIQNYADIPVLDCFPGQLNQVFMNILANAIDMFDEMAQQSSWEDLKANPQQIMIQTNSTDQGVKIRIRDNGKGMSETVKDRIFDRLFTTKSVGKGTGLGLAIVHQIVVEKHCGAIVVNSEISQGTEFVLTLPLA